MTAESILAAFAAMPKPPAEKVVLCDSLGRKRLSREFPSVAAESIPPLTGIEIAVRDYLPPDFIKLVDRDELNAMDALARGDYDITVRFTADLTGPGRDRFKAEF